MVDRIENLDAAIDEPDRLALGKARWRHQPLGKLSGREFKATFALVISLLPDRMRHKRP